MLTAAFAVYQKKLKKLLYEIGGRYDYTYLQAVTISSTLPREIERFNHNFHNYSLAAGLQYKLLANLTADLNVGHVLRSPQINELYSQGLHQGVSGIEEGNRSMKK